VGTADSAATMAALQVRVVGVMAHLLVQISRWA
jgi:hypothetical protein